ncbi:phospholipid scramblase family member 5-like [Chelonoidis abingdonii]|uniref:phospholipid scramblase family member 5-like n=1 Tax=Chelonoidis abingdonii TaxID=106734 RepID=UPI0013F17FF6|nr:phospholipid scramblase family member 5-like [Chelonoidis abingdonii]
MAALSSQPSPFGHLTRERHIQALVRSLRKEDGSPGRQARGTSPSWEGTSRANQAQEPAFGSSQRSLEPAWQVGADAPSSAEDLGHQLKGWRGRGSERDESAGEEATESPLLRLGWWGRRARRQIPEQSLQRVQEDDDIPPLGLQVLAGASQLRITARAGLRGLAGDPGRTYVVGTAPAKGLLVAIEETSRLCLHLCGPARSCHIHLRDPQGQDVLWLRRPFGAGASCLGCCRTEMRVFTVGDQLVGSVRQRWGILAHRWDLRDPHGAATMRIRGSCAASRCSSNQEFQVTSRAGSPVAVIWKRWPGFNEDRNTDHEFFGVDISANLGAEDTALLLAAAFLLNFMFFEMS